MIKPIQKSILTTKPIKMPKGLIYRHPNSDVYHLIEVETKRIVGKMSAFITKSDALERDFYNVGADKDIFYINSLEITSWKRNQGWGKYFIDFAKRESHYRGCEGRTFLVAYNYNKPPQVFYKKQGFVAANKEKDRELDRCVEMGTAPYHSEVTDMFLPLEESRKYKVSKATSEPKKGLLQTIKDFFVKHFS